MMQLANVLIKVDFIILHMGGIMKGKFLASLVGLIFIGTLSALPSQIIVVRHAEKPDEGNELSTRGWERAEALAPNLLGNRELLKFGPPTILIAASPKKNDSSVRSIQTLEPLARALKIQLQEQFHANQYAELAQYVKENPALNGKVVIIAWPHEYIPSLVHALGVNPEPPKWSGMTFDRYWVITYQPDGSANFQDLPQRLLFGDSPQ